MKKLFSLFYGGKDKFFFIENNEQIKNYNLKAINIALIVMAAYALIYLVFDFNTSNSQFMRLSLLIFFLVFLFAIELNYFVIYKFIKKTNLYYFIITELFFAFLLFIGPIFDSAKIACFIPVFFIAVYLVPIIPIHYLTVVELCNLAIFIVIDYFFKGPELCLFDSINSLATLGLGIVLGTNSLIARVNSLASYNELKQNSESELKQALDKAYMDALTGCSSRFAFEAFEAKINKQIREKMHPEFAVVMCDINDLKMINDMQGHDEGDKLIQKTAKTLKEVFQNSTVYRYGGDEFVVVLQDKDYNDRKHLMEMIKYAPFASGIATYDNKKDLRFKNVCDRADRNMYISKKEMKNN